MLTSARIGWSVIKPKNIMPEAAILDDILKELKRAKKKHPQWPDHIVARAAIVGEEAGELVRAALQFKYDSASHGSKERFDQLDALRKEAIQTAAMAIRFLEILKDQY